MYVFLIQLNTCIKEPDEHVLVLLVVCFMHISRYFGWHRLPSVKPSCANRTWPCNFHLL